MTNLHYFLQEPIDADEAFPRGPHGIRTYIIEADTETDARARLSDALGGTLPGVTWFHHEVEKSHLLRVLTMSIVGELAGAYDRGMRSIGYLFEGSDETRVLETTPDGFSESLVEVTHNITGNDFMSLGAVQLIAEDMIEQALAARVEVALAEGDDRTGLADLAASAADAYDLTVLFCKLGV